jgi:hypothetical protein
LSSLLQQPSDKRANGKLHLSVLECDSCYANPATAKATLEIGAASLLQDCVTTTTKKAGHEALPECFP